MPTLTEREVRVILTQEALGMAQQETLDFLTRAIAAKRIGAWRQQHYLDTVRLEITHGGRLVLRFADKSGLQIEEGVPAKDLRYLSSSGKAKTGDRGGWYIDIPFYAASAKEAASAHLLPPQVRRQAPPKIESMLTDRARSAGLSVLPDARLKKSEFPDENRLKAQHLYGSTQGMIRHGSHNQWAKISQFATIRRLSDKSPAGSWIVPSQPGVQLQPEADRFFRERVSQIVDNSLKELRKMGASV